MNQSRGRLSHDRGIADIIGASFNLYSATPAVLLSIAVLNIPVSLVSTVVSSLTDRPAINGLLALLMLPVELVAYQVISAGIVAALLEFDSGRTASAGAAISAATARFDDLASATLRATAIVFLFCVTIVGIPWGIMRLVRWLFIVQAILVDKQTGDSSLSFSASLVDGNWWLTVGRMFLIGVLFAIPTAIVTLAGAAAPLLVGSAITAIVGAIVMPFTVIASTLIYFDYRLEKRVNAAVSPA